MADVTVAVFVGEIEQQTRRAWFTPGMGLKKPYVVATMDPEWFEAAREGRMPRFFFERKIDLMHFALGHHIVCVEAVDGTEETASMGASMFAMGAVSIPIGDKKGAAR